jgi:hypothetical protein
MGNAGATFAKEGLELGEQLALEDRLQDVERYEVTTAVDEAEGAEPTAGNHAMNANPHLRVMVSAAIRDDEVSRLYPRRHKSVRKGG